MNEVVLVKRIMFLVVALTAAFCAGQTLSTLQMVIARDTPARWTIYVIAAIDALMAACAIICVYFGTKDWKLRGNKQESLDSSP